MNCQHTSSSSSNISINEIAHQEFLTLSYCAPFPSNCFSERIINFPTATSFVNMRKNRYPTILPKEQTRIRLTTGNNDYINANLVKGPSGCKTDFICTQAPLSTTTEDFWRMIWEQQSYVILMLTQLQESGQEKSFQYWPEEVGETVNYGELSVLYHSTQQKGSVQHRIFELKYQSSTRKIYHLQFLVWPDHGVPTDTREVYNLVKLTSDLMKLTSFSGPMVVHCSAGVGRTGTFVSLYQYFELLQGGQESPSVFDIVRLIRYQRDSMVQNVSQYHFIYKTIQEVLYPSRRLSCSTDSEDKATSSNISSTIFFPRVL